MAKPILTFENQLRIGEYAEGYRLYDLRCGNSAGREIKASLFFFLGMAMLFMLMREQFNILKLPVCTIVLLICIYMCCFFIYILPNMAKQRGERIYKSSHLLSEKYTFHVHQDYFIMQNEYESLKRYYTEIHDCIETDTLFLLIGGTEKKLIVIAKRCLEQEQCETLSHFFRKEMVHQYRRTRFRRRKKK